MIRLYVLLALYILGVNAMAAVPDTTKPASNTQTVNIVIGAQPTSQMAVPTSPVNVNDDLSFGQWLLVFLPLIVFLFLFMYFMSWLKKDDYKLASALSACDPVSITKTEVAAAPTPALPGTTPAVAGVATTTTQDVLPKSSSRLIAFLTAMTAICIAVVVVSLEIYIALSGRNGSFNTDGLWKLIASLGIGVIPYGANMIKEAVQDPPKKV